MEKWLEGDAKNKITCRCRYPSAKEW